MNETWTTEATTWCKWYVTRPHTQPYIYQIYNGEGNLHGMVASCVGYMWEHDDPKAGITAYHAYLQHEYGYTADGVRNNPRRLLPWEAMPEFENAYSDIDLAERGEAAPPSEPFEGSRWSLPALLAVATTKKGRTALNEGPRRQTMTEWLDSLPVLEQDILSTYADVGRAATAEYCHVPAKKVDYIIDKVRRAVARAVAA